jgi:hypothetical protein
MKSPRRRAVAYRSVSAVLAVTLLGSLLAACAPAPTPGGPTPQQQFCEFWDKAAEEAPSQDNALLVKSDVVAMADEAQVIGSSCLASGAKVELDGAVLAEGTEVPVEQGTASTETVAAVTGDEIGPGEIVLDNVRVRALSASIGLNGITLRGNVDLTLSGVTSTVGFTGTLSNLNTWSVNLASANLIIPGITTSPVLFSGTLRVAYGVPSLSLAASATSVKVGDVTVANAALKVDASPVAGVKAKVEGNLKIGPSTVAGIVDVGFDKTGTLVSAKANIDARLVGTMAGGKKADLTGKVKIEGNGQKSVVSFAGSGVLGDLVVNEANGSLSLASNKATFVGKVDVAQGASSVRFNGSIVWDGITAYTPFLTLEGEGEFSGTLADGKTVSVAGNISTEVVGGQLRAVVNGNFKVGTLAANGSAIVEVNGATTTLFVDASLVDAGFAAKLEGAVIITDGVAETVQLDAVVDGSVKLGDATLTGATLSIRSSNGNPLDLSFSGGLKVGNQLNLSGSLAASFGPNGGLLNMTGNLSGSALLDSWGLVDFAGGVAVTVERVTVNGTGSLRTTNFPLGVSFKGTFTSSLSEPTWSLTGSGKLSIASLNIASARLSLSQTAGMQATRAGFYLSIIGIPTYLEGNFYMKAEGGCSKVQLTGGSFLARPLAALILPGIINCPVSI